MNKRIRAALAALLTLLCLSARAEAVDMTGIAGASDMTEALDIVPEGLVPVTADRLNDGTWPVEVVSASSMFKPAGCDLTVAGGAMTATLYMGSESYSHMYPGAAEDAARADAGALCPLQTLADGRRAFVLPVDRLDAGFTCAAFSVRKQLWYPRTLLFRADSLPLRAWRPEYLDTAESLGLEDGAYRCAVTLAGEGRAALESPAELIVSGGACTAEITFATGRIGYVIVDGVRCEPVAAEGGAAFRVPVAAFGRGLRITVCSTAITPAVEVEYTMTFDPGTLEPA